MQNNQMTNRFLVKKSIFGLDFLEKCLFVFSIIYAASKATHGSTTWYEKKLGTHTGCRNIAPYFWKKWIFHILLLWSQYLAKTAS